MNLLQKVILLLTSSSILDSTVSSWLPDVRGQRLRRQAVPQYASPTASSTSWNSNTGRSTTPPSAVSQSPSFNQNETSTQLSQPRWQNSTLTSEDISGMDSSLPNTSSTENAKHSSSASTLPSSMISQYTSQSSTSFDHQPTPPLPTIPALHASISSTQHSSPFPSSKSLNNQPIPSAFPHTSSIDFQNVIQPTPILLRVLPNDTETSAPSNFIAISNVHSDSPITAITSMPANGSESGETTVIQSSQPLTITPPNLSSFMPVEPSLVSPQLISSSSSTTLTINTESLVSSPLFSSMTSTNKHNAVTSTFTQHFPGITPRTSGHGDVGGYQSDTSSPNHPGTTPETPGATMSSSFKTRTFVPAHITDTNSLSHSASLPLTNAQNMVIFTTEDSITNRKVTLPGTPIVAEHIHTTDATTTTPSPFTDVGLHSVPSSNITFVSQNSKIMSTTYSLHTSHHSESMTPTNSQSFHTTPISKPVTSHGELNMNDSMSNSENPSSISTTLAPQLTTYKMDTAEPVELPKSFTALEPTASPNVDRSKPHTTTNPFNSTTVPVVDVNASEVLISVTRPSRSTESALLISLTPPSSPATEGLLAALLTTHAWPTVEAVNTRPKLVNRLSPIYVTAGTYFEFQIPAATFYDFEQGNTRNLSLTLEFPSGQILGKDSWVQLNRLTQMLYGIPLQKVDGVKSNIFVVRASDSERLSVSDVFQIQIETDTRVTPSFVFVAEFDLDYAAFMSNFNNVVDLVRQISSFCGDKATLGITVTKIEQGSVILHWTNQTISQNYCNNSTISLLYDQFVGSDRNASVDFQAAMLPKYPVMQMNLEFQGICVPAHEVRAAAQTTEPSVTESPHTASLWLIIFLPILLLVLVVAGLITAAWCLYQRRQLCGSLNLDDEKPIFTKNRKPILLENELELCSRGNLPHQPVVMGNKSPITYANPGFGVGEGDQPVFQVGAVAPLELDDIQAPEYFSTPISADMNHAPPPYRLPPPYRGPDIDNFFD